MLIDILEHPILAKSDPLSSTTLSEGTVAEKLKEISDVINLQSTSDETVVLNELSFATEDLITYLNNHVYTAAPFIGYGGGLRATTDESSKNDIVNLVKTDIRSVKGAVLNM